MLKITPLSKISANIKDYLLLLISLIIICGAIVYYLDAFYYYDLIVVAILVICSFLFLGNRLIETGQEQNNLQTSKLIVNKSNWKYFLTYGLIYIFLITNLFLSQSDKALISPWQVIKPAFFIAYALASLILIFSLISDKLGNKAKILLISLHYFISLIIAVIIYKIGYGFDPFIHQATMELIDKNGLVTPKPPYYLGQYSLIIILHKISGLSIYFLNKILVPFLAAIFIPLSAYNFLKSFFVDPRDTNIEHNNAARFLSLLFLLIITFSPFILTTPQNLSYLFLILTIFNGLGRNNLIWPSLLALATAAIHPLTGLPALGWVVWLIFKKNEHKLRLIYVRIFRIIIFSATSLIIPATLFFIGGANLKIININADLLTDPFKNLLAGLSMAGAEDWFFNIIYFFGSNFNLFLILIILASIIYFYRQKNRPDWSSIVNINLSLIIAYILSSQIIFNDLINYEQSSYAGRLLIIICFFNLPYIIWAIEKLITKIIRQDKFVIAIWLVLGISLLLISLYISYPRYDKYFNSRGYSVSANDLKAVQLIELKSKEPYLVLANQQVSVAALKELGFNNYYQTSKGLLYFYPIPTGGPLYQYYLDMVYKSPSQNNIQGALELFDVKSGYLIINKYWDNSAIIINEAKLEAATWFDVNGEVYVFKYESKK